MSALTMAKTVDMPRDKWLALRRFGIGGSDAAAILGLNPWKTAMDIWLEKTGEFTADDFPDNEKMYWGNVLEDIVAREFTARTGLKARRRNAILQHREHHFMIANVDRLVVGRRAGLECKTAGEYAKETWAMGVPELYQAQAQHYMAVTGYKAWYVAVLIGGQEFRHYLITRDNTFISELVAAETLFWQQVEAGTPPPVDGTKASTELLKKLYPRAEKGREVQLPFAAYALVQQYEQAGAEEKRVQLAKEEAANKLKEMLGTAERGFIHDRQITWQSIASQRLDSRALQKECPDTYEKFLRPSNYRRFSIK